jgi:osmotically-inducible protein OsmY
MANNNQRPRRDQYYRADNGDQARRDFKYENEVERNDFGTYDQTYPIGDRENSNEFAGNNERYYGSARSGQWNRGGNRFDPDRYNPNGGRFGHQGQRTSHDDNSGNSGVRREDHFNTLSGSGRSYRSNNDLRRDFERGMGYANYGSSEGAGDSLNAQRESNRTGESSWFDSDNRTIGKHRGKGPRGYQRSDERIKEDINDRLSDDPFVDASDIEVTVEKGEVTLSGNVEDRQEKRKAEEIAEAVSGVLNVENRIRVGRGMDIGRSRDKEGNSNIGNGNSINGGV